MYPHTPSDGSYGAGRPAKERLSLQNASAIRRVPVELNSSSNRLQEVEIQQQYFSPKANPPSAGGNIAGSSLHPTLGHRLAPGQTSAPQKSPPSRFSASQRLEVPVERVTITLQDTAIPQVAGKRKPGRPRVSGSPLQGVSSRKRNLTRTKVPSKKRLYEDPLLPPRTTSSDNPPPQQGPNTSAVKKKKTTVARKQKNKVDFQNPPNSLP